MPACVPACVSACVGVREAVGVRARVRVRVACVRARARPHVGAGVCGCERVNMCVGVCPSTADKIGPRDSRGDRGAGARSLLCSSRVCSRAPSRACARHPTGADGLGPDACAKEERPAGGTHLFCAEAPHAQRRARASRAGARRRTRRVRRERAHVGARRGREARPCVAVGSKGAQRSMPHHPVRLRVLQLLGSSCLVARTTHRDASRDCRVEAGAARVCVCLRSMNVCPAAHTIDQSFFLSQWRDRESGRGVGEAERGRQTPRLPSSPWSAAVSGCRAAAAASPRASLARRSSGRRVSQVWRSSPTKH